MKTFLVSVIVILSVSCTSGCKKKSNDKSELSYVVTIHDTTIHQFENKHFLFPVSISTIGLSEPITVSISDLPSWASARSSSFDVNAGSVANFDISANPKVVGTFPFKITVSSKSVESKSYNANLVVLPYTSVTYRFERAGDTMPPPDIILHRPILNSINVGAGIWNRENIELPIVVTPADSTKSFQLGVYAESNIMPCVIRIIVTFPNYILPGVYPVRIKTIVPGVDTQTNTVFNIKVD